MATVALADDHLILLEPLAGMINNLGGFNVIYYALNGVELINCVEQHGPPDILILDLDMPVMNGFEVAVWFREHHPATKILMLTMYDSDFVLIRLLKAGVHGFLKKNSRPDELKEAMLYVLEHTTPYLMSKDAARLLELVRNADQIKKSLLDERELLFIKMVCIEGDVVDVAKKMDISSRTAYNLMDSVMEKLKLKNRIQLVVHAMNSGIMKM